MERFTSERLCPVCKAKMTFEHETLDGWITLKEAIKRHCLALAQSPEFQAPVVERMEY